MKKLLSLILMLAVTLLPISALAASGDAILLRRGEDGYNSSVFSIAEVEGAIYALTYDGLYVFASGETKPVHYDFPISSTVDDGTTMKIPSSAAAFPRSSPTKAVPASSLPGWRRNTRAWAKNA